MSKGKKENDFISFTCSVFMNGYVYSAAVLKSSSDV